MHDRQNMAHHTVAVSPFIKRAAVRLSAEGGEARPNCFGSKRVRGRTFSKVLPRECRNRVLKNDDMQGAQIPRNEAYIEVRRSDEG